jgi:hypothetical protein
VFLATNSFDAEQGGVNGAAVNVQIKSGTNKFHGDADEFHTDDQSSQLLYQSSHNSNGRSTSSISTVAQ